MLKKQKAVSLRVFLYFEFIHIKKMQHNSD